jgi:opacity protein-like surface antigen
MAQRSLIATLTICWLLASAGPARAQTDSGGTASLIVSGMPFEEGVSAGITGAMGYRFNRIVSLGLEVTSVPAFEPELPEVPNYPPYLLAGNATTFTLDGGSDISGLVIPSPFYSFGDPEGQITVFTTNLRLDVPAGARRWSPYLVGGAGVAHVQEEFTITTTFPRGILTGVSGPTFLIPPISQEIESASTDMAVTIGGGIALRAGDHLTFDVDARYLAVFGFRDLQVGKVGVGVSYRF